MAETPKTLWTTVLSVGGMGEARNSVLIRPVRDGAYVRRIKDDGYARTEDILFVDGAGGEPRLIETIKGNPWTDPDCADAAERRADQIVAAALDGIATTEAEGVL